jgi:outer membrane protein assembly factor BamD (BamD/ComL family)
MIRRLHLTLVFAVVISAQTALCDSSPTDAIEREDLYTDGLKAYDAKDYVTALKDLFAFETLNEKRLQTSTSANVKDARARLDQAITDSETKLHTIVNQWAHVGRMGIEK